MKTKERINELTKEIDTLRNNKSILHKWEMIQSKKYFNIFVVRAHIGVNRIELINLLKTIFLQRYGNSVDYIGGYSFSINKDIDNVYSIIRDSLSYNVIRLAIHKAEKEIDELKRCIHGDDLLSYPDEVLFIDTYFVDGAMNDYNKLSLCKYLSGETKEFTGMVNPKWIDGVNALGANNNGVVSFEKIKEVFINKR